MGVGSKGGFATLSQFGLLKTVKALTKFVLSLTLNVVNMQLCTPFTAYAHALNKLNMHGKNASFEQIVN